MKIKLPLQNKYFPSDTFEIFSKIQEIDGKFFHFYNFYYLFNMPKCSLIKDKLKIQINDTIQHYKWNPKFLDTIKNRITSFIEKFKDHGYQLKAFKATCIWRLIIGLGASHPQETSMTLHHIYGIPYIPGSAVKGVTRHWVIFSKHDNSEGKAEKNEEFVKVFGTQKKSGKVIFMDAYPVGDINLKIDIMNPHYPEYYSDFKPPADWQTPKPIKFLTVEKTKFQFVLLSKDQALLDKACEWLKEALQNFGIGAKTSLGYGIFQITPDAN